MSKQISGMINPADLILPAQTGYGRPTIGALYLGSVSALTVEFLRKNNITVIVSMTRVPAIKSVKHLQYPIPDHRSSNQRMQQILPQICADIHRYRMAGHNVLVHCYAGIHRAPTVVCHYLQRYEGHSVNSCVNLIRRARYIAFIDGNTFDLKA
jgi:protein-tyrosine phosphatase